MDKCNICYLSVDPSTYYPCPECQNSFHKDHFAAWVFENETCPVCGRKMNDQVITELAPKTENEAEKMREINRKLARAARLAHSFDSKYGKNARKKRLREVKQQRKSQENKSFFRKILPFLLFVGWMGIGFWVSRQF